MKIGIVAPSDWFSKKLLAGGIRIIEKHGHEVVLAKNINKKIKDFMAGSVEERLADLAELANSDAEVIWAAEGGYAATEIRYGLEEIKNGLKERLLIGYSDITNLHLAWRCWGGRGLYAPTVCRLSQWSIESTDKLFELLDGSTSMSYEGGVGVVSGKALGTMVAGNLETMTLCAGTEYDPLLMSAGPVILGIEEYQQELSLINRQLDQVLDSKRIGRVTGFVLGRFCQLKESSYPEWAKQTSVSEMISNKLLRRGIRIPVWQFDGWGHETRKGAKDDFYPIMNGAKTKLDVDSGGGRMKMEWS